MLTFPYIFSLILLTVAITAGPVAGDETVDRDLNRCPVRFAIIGDRTGEAQEGIYEQIVAEVERLRPEFVLTVGDMVEGPVPDSATLEARWQEYKAIIEPLSVPVHFTPGNNDLSTEDDVGTWRRYTGNEPYYSFDYGSLHFVVLDNSRWTTVEEFPEEQIAWLANDLAIHRDARYTFVLFHIPFWYRTLADNRPDTLHSLFTAYGVDAVFTGHFHRYFAGEFDGIKYTGVGSSGGGTERRPGDLDYHFVWVTVSGDDIAIAPIEINSVRAWDEVSVADLRYYETVRRLGISFVNAAPATEWPIKVGQATVDVDICNVGQAKLADTIRWTVPAGWSVRPGELAVQVDPGDTTRVSFEVECTGDLYPLPEVSLDFPYKDNRCSAQRLLRVARRAICLPAGAPPVIDGVLDETFWQNPCSGLLSPEGKRTRTEPAEFYFAYDADNLYLAARCSESRMDSLYASFSGHDDLVYQEDCVGFLYRPLGQEGSIYQLYVNPLGTVFDQEITRGSDGYWDGSQSWNGEYEIAAKVFDSFWTVEVRVPLQQFGTSAVAGQIWDFNFRHKQRRLNAAGGWQIPHGYDPNGFGQLLMQ